MQRAVSTSPVMDFEKVLRLQLYGLLHGEVVHPSFPGRALKLEKDDSTWDLQTLVSNPSKILQREITDVAVAGFESQLRLFTYRLLWSGYRFENSQVRVICSTGDHVSPRLEKWYRMTWGVPFDSRYGLTEIVGGARRCQLCAKWHLEPHVIGEVVDCGAGSHVKPGDYGVLLLTSLFPFVKKQPMLRYWTGDLVRVHSEDCPVDRLAFTFAGRLSKCLMDVSSLSQQPLVSSSEIYDVLDNYCEIATTPQFQGLWGVVDAGVLGYLKFELSDELLEGRQVVTLMIETRFNPLAFPDKAKELTKDIYCAVLASQTRLRSRIESDTAALIVDLRQPGSLSAMMVAQIE